MVEKKRGIIRATCWLCRIPFDFNIGKDLGGATLSSILQGVRRIRYLQYCKKCCKLTIAEAFSAKTEGSRAWQDKLSPAELKKWCKKHPIENIPPVDIPLLPEENPVRNWANLKRKHMYLMDGRCQICDRKDKTVDIYRKTNRRKDRTPLMRDTIALCSVCHKTVGYRLATHTDD